MATRYANQMQITVHKSKTVKGDLYTKVKYEDLALAARSLSNSAFKLYMYLASNSDKYSLFLSQVDFEENFGVKKDSYYRAVEELKKVGYLVRTNTAVNNWEFYETPVEIDNSKFKF